MNKLSLRFISLSSLVLAGAALLPMADAGAQAQNTRARMIYPDFPGASQTCLMTFDPNTRRPSRAMLAEVMLGDCPAGWQNEFVVANRQIKLASNPKLCVAASAGARRATLYLEDCKDSNVDAWDAAGSSTVAARIRIAGGPFDNQCLAIPQLNDARNPRLPYAVELKDCGRGDLKFFVE